MRAVLAVMALLPQRVLVVLMAIRGTQVVLAAQAGDLEVLAGLAVAVTEVTAAVLVAGIEKAIFERFFVCEKKEPFGVHVESSEGKAPRREVEFLQSALPFVPGVGIKLAKNTVGFVEGNEHRLAGS